MEKRELLNVKKVFYDIDPKMAKKIPQFVFYILRKIICQDEVNLIYTSYQDRMGLDFVDGIMEYFNVKTTYEGADNINKDKKYIFVANHPTAGIDGIALCQVIGKFYQENFKYIVNDILLNIKNLEPIFIPVSTHGKQKREYAVKIDELFRSEKQVLICPSGICSRRVNGEIIDLNWNKTFLQKSIQYKRDIIPVHISGRCSNFFYNFARFRERIGIKSGIEEFLLPKEMLKLKNKDIHFKFGEEISYLTFDQSKNFYEWSQLVKQKLYEL